jgi:hypothetical protein
MYVHKRLLFSLKLMSYYQRHYHLSLSPVYLDICDSDTTYVPSFRFVQNQGLAAVGQLYTACARIWIVFYCDIYEIYLTELSFGSVDEFMNVYTVTSECAAVKCVLEESRTSKLEGVMVGYVTVLTTRLKAEV